MGVLFLYYSYGERYKITLKLKVLYLRDFLSHTNFNYISRKEILCRFFVQFDHFANMNILAPFRPKSKNESFLAPPGGLKLLIWDPYHIIS